jgi:hypothetical protein
MVISSAFASFLIVLGLGRLGLVSNLAIVTC